MVSGLERIMQFKQFYILPFTPRPPGHARRWSAAPAGPGWRGRARRRGGLPIPATAGGPGGRGGAAEEEDAAGLGVDRAVEGELRARYARTRGPRWGRTWRATGQGSRRCRPRCPSRSSATAQEASGHCTIWRLRRT
uniref:Uncharacterized protein n=1 Tax=Arundo donax TaxID=35708 RepID=A0A0A9AAU3_ARUDO